MNNTLLCTMYIEYKGPLKLYYNTIFFFLLTPNLNSLLKTMTVNYCFFSSRYYQWALSVNLTLFMSGEARL